MHLIIWTTLVHVIERQITVHYEDSDKGTVFGECFTYRPSIDIIYYPKERDDKGELIMYQSNPSLTIPPPPGKPPGNLFDERIPHPPGKESSKLRTLGL